MASLAEEKEDREEGRREKIVGWCYVVVGNLVSLFCLYGTLF